MPSTRTSSGWTRSSPRSSLPPSASRPRRRPLRHPGSRPCPAPRRPHPPGGPRQARPSSCSPRPGRPRPAALTPGAPPGGPPGRRVRPLTSRTPDSSPIPATEGGQAGQDKARPGVAPGARRGSPAGSPAAACLSRHPPDRGPRPARHMQQRHEEVKPGRPPAWADDAGPVLRFDRHGQQVTMGTFCSGIAGDGPDGPRCCSAPARASAVPTGARSLAERQAGTVPGARPRMWPAGLPPP